MDRHADLDAVLEHGLGLAAAAERVGMDLPVASCPGWDVADVVWHSMEAHWFWGVIVAQRVQDPSTMSRRTRPAVAELLAEQRESVALLHAALETAPDDTAVWTWSDRKDVAFVRRRIAQETAVHRWDIETADGSRWDLPVDLAADGIDEFLEIFLPDVVDGAPDLGGTVHIHTTDPAGPTGEWLIVLDDDGEPIVTREHAKGSCALRGSASDILLVLWRRLPLSSIDVVGDADVAARFVARADLS